MRGFDVVGSRDEDTFVFPSAWCRHRCARRGSSGDVTFTLEPQAQAIVGKAFSRRVNRVLQAPTTEPALAHQALAWRQGKPDATPLGAAAVAAAAEVGNWRIEAPLVHFADVWIAGRGLRFAAEAATELMALKAVDDNLPAEMNFGVPPEDTAGVRHLRPGKRGRITTAAWRWTLPCGFGMRSRLPPMRFTPA